MEEQTKRRRKKTSYKKINNETRQRLIDMVRLEIEYQVSTSNYLLKDAAKILDINYSTAKTIIRIFRLENRKEKKNADEERLMKNLLHQIRKDKDDIVSVISEESKNDDYCHDSSGIQSSEGILR
jgi:hypothetical protein